MLRWLPLVLPGLLTSRLLPAAEAAAEKLAVQSSPLGSTTLFQTAGGLLLILGLILGGAWLFKRYGNLPMGGKGVIKVLGGASVGARERVVLIEVENVRLLLGVAPGHVRTLHRLPLDERSFQHAMNLIQEAPKVEEGTGTKAEEGTQT
ncbi:MAG: flagellar biosynthetic protein FliO [Candidatus Thiodiazotropha sp.]|jgi:flagellar protein FliO/FliZ